MKSFVKTSLLALVVSGLFTTSASAGWVTEDGKAYTQDCCKKRVVKKVKRVKKAPAFCETCDYSKFPMATLLPLAAGEKLAPATLRNCGK